jgi:predicted N-acyltransferase
MATDIPITPIKGYRQLTQDEIDLMNEAKAIAVTVGAFVEKVKATEGTDPRWVAEGRTDLQKGFMSLIRGIARPETF